MDLRLPDAKGLLTGKGSRWWWSSARVNTSTASYAALSFQLPSCHERSNACSTSRL